jgi:phosphomannomutase/phosphoglucomutase
MDPSIFRAYSIRGIADETLTIDDMLRIGHAAGTLLGGQSIRTAVVGHDYRSSSGDLVAALKRGLLSAGIDVIGIGPCPTPMLNFATDHYRVGAGLMVTASHNPANHNGLKIRTDHTLRGDEIQRIRHIATGNLSQQESAPPSGTITPADPFDSYLDAICACVSRRGADRPLCVVVDAGNGAAGPVAPLLLERLGCSVISLYCDPDGSFPNRVPDPTAPGALDALSTRVVAAGADAGLAYDGDGDRVAMVDETGQVVFADRLLALLAREALRDHPGARVVYELSCTQAVPEIVESEGGEAIPSPVGYAFVHETMRTREAILGGEAAGHLFFAEPAFQFDDAMLASAKMVSLLSRAHRPFSALLSTLPKYVLSPDYRFHCPDGQKQAVVAALDERFAAQGYTIERMDGAKVRFGDGWGLFRQSNTQPAVTLRCEARTPEQLTEIETTMLDAVRKALANVGVEMKSAH